MRYFFLPLAAALGLSACAPRALFFHESTKVAFAADYNTSDTQPLATSFGYKRRIVAVVPGQERNIPAGGSERTATNTGEALSLVSKFNVRAGTSEGVTITNNFASGMAARIMTRTAGPDGVKVLMHNDPIPVSTETGKTLDGNQSAMEAVDQRLARIKSREVSGAGAPRSRGTLPLPKPKEGSNPPPSTGTLPLPPLPPNDGVTPPSGGTSPSGAAPASSGTLPVPKVP